MRTPKKIRNPVATEPIRLASDVVEIARELARRLGNNNHRWVIETCVREILGMADQPRGTRQIPHLVMMADLTRAKPLPFGDTRELERTFLTESPQRN